MKLKYCMMRNNFLLPKNHVKNKSLYFQHIVSKEQMFEKTYLGEEQNNTFYPSPYCLLLFSKNANTIIINNKNAWHFTTGKAIPFDAIIKGEIKNETSDMFIVKNGHNEIVGVAQKKEHSFFNVFDIGHYLRREMNS